MPQTIQDVIRERDNAKREAAGKKADATAASQINVGDLGAAARAAAAKRQQAPKPVATPAPKLKRGGVVRGMASRKC